MRIIRLDISGFRNLDELSIQDSDLDGNTIFLVGRNGAGKSTILEIIAHLLGPTELSSLSQTNFASGINNEDKARFYIELTFDEKEKLSLQKLLAVANPRYVDAYNDELKLIRTENDYTFSIEAEIVKQKDNLDVPYRVLLKFNNDSEAVPYWLSTAKSQRFLCAYFSNIGNLTLDPYQGLNAPANIPVPGQFLNSNINLDNRHQSADVSLNTVLNSLASLSVWKRVSTDKSFLQNLDINSDLEKLNIIINPLKIEFDREVLFQTGVFNFSLRNESTGKSYALSQASSGERRIMALWWAYLTYSYTDFKPLLLFDEPDTNLHPEYINRLSQFIRDSMEENEENLKGQSFIATHSPDLIFNNPQNVYRVSEDLKSVQKVKGLDEKVELLNSLGRSFELSFIAEKVIFVEGVKANQDHLEDHVIYRKLIDPKEDSIAFIPAGSKSSAIKQGGVFEELSERLKIDENISTIFALVDSDNEESNKKLIPTPFNCVENVFLLFPDLIEDTIKLKIDETFILGNIPDFVVNDKLKDDGKELFAKVDKWLSANYSAKYKQLGKKKGLQIILIENIVQNSDRFPDELKEFIATIKNL